MAAFFVGGDDTVNRDGNEMSFNPEIHHRRTLRMRDCDYRGAGAYFVTICAFQRECLFGEVVDGVMVLNSVGSVVVQCWQRIPDIFPQVDLDVFVVLPNHFHAILHVSGSSMTGSNVGAKQAVSASPGSEDVHGNKTGNTGKGEAGESFASPLRPQGTQSGSLGAIVQNFKSVSTRKINTLRDNPGCPDWQRNYYDRVIRGEKELANIRQYIADNPAKWDLDEDNPVNAGKFP
jgi:REP element-mobilizing transposase RayT